jgi:hypothetical protein
VGVGYASRMIRTELIRQLTLAAASSPRHARHISAASGIVVAGHLLYVVADDEHHLGVFEVDGQCEGELVRIFPGDLPHDPVARKAAKPDLEALTRLPPFTGYPAGALLALASGSKRNRHAGAVLGLDASGRIVGMPHPIDLSALYATLLHEFPALNIEGAVVLGEELLLLQRGSRGHPESAVISYSLIDIFRVIGAGDAFGMPTSPARVQVLDLGTIEGVPLGFTDGTALADGRIVFSAVAERADDTYQDGPCVGAAIGILAADGRVQLLEQLEQTQKVEGIHAVSDGDNVRLLLVTDADDPELPSNLLSATIADCGRRRR